MGYMRRGAYCDFIIAARREKMKKRIFCLALFVFLSASFAASLRLNPGDSQVKAQQKATQEQQELMAQKPSVMSVNPQKIQLALGGETVIVEVKGTNLTMIDSVQLTRGGLEVPGIKEVLDRSQLPTMLKITLKAGPQAQLANDYRLTLFGAGKNKILEVPGNLVAIDTVPLPDRPLLKESAKAAKTTEGAKAIDQQKEILPKPIMIAKPSLVSASSQKAVLARGGEAVVIEAKGANLTSVNSVQVTRAGNPVPGIEASIDKSVGPAGLKITLKASSQAQVAGDYVLTLYDDSKNKILDVPTTVLAIEVKPGGGGAITTPKAPSPGTPQQTAKATTGQEKPMPILKQQPGIETGKRTTKVEAYLKSVETAQSLEEVRAGFAKAGLSQSEAEGLKREIEASPALKQKLEGLVRQDQTKVQAKVTQFKREASAKVEALKTQYATSQQVKIRTAEGLLSKMRPGACPPSDKLIIEKISGEPIEPGVVFAVSGKGFGSDRGSLDLMFGGHTYPAFIMEWTECYVHARLSDEITAVRPSKDAMLVLKKPDGKEIRQPTSFQPLLEYASIIDEEGITYDSELVPGLLLGGAAVDLGESKDWTKNNFQLINDWVVKDRVLQVSSHRGHAEITSASALDTPNGSARTDVHAGREAYGYARWTLSTCVVGPKGLPYR